MSLPIFSGGSASKLGLVRSMVLVVFVVALVMLMTGTVMDQHGCQVCVEQVQTESSEVDGVLRRELKQPQNQSSADPAPSLIPWDYNWDFKAANSSADISEIPSRNLILVRHGQFDLETRKLTPLGREQADMTGRRLKEMNLTHTTIVHSPAERAAETAQIIHDHLPHVPLDMDHMLREGEPIPPNPADSYSNDPQRDHSVDGPRLEAAFRKYFYRPGREQKIETFEILVGHSNMFRFFALRALQLPKDAWMRVSIGHASITMLDLLADGRVTMTKFGDTGHMPSNKVTYYNSFNIKANMTYKSVWWYPNYIEYGAGLNSPKTWPQVKEQYQRPHALFDLRYYDLPEEQYEERLLYRLPRLGMPQYRALFRDRPHTVPRHYPDVSPEGKPLGFHGRMYYEDGPPQFKYQGRKKDEAYWLERQPYLPVMEERRLLSTKRNYESYRGINPEKLSLSVDAQGSPFCGCANNYAGVSKVNEPSSRFVRSTSIDGIKRQTQDGVGLF